MPAYRVAGRRRHLLRLRLAAASPFAEGPARGHVAVRGIVRRRLVGHEVGHDAAPQNLREHLRRIAEEPDRARLPLAGPALHHGEGFVEVVGALVEIAGPDPGLDPLGVALDREADGARKGRGERLRAAHAAEPGREDPAPRQVAVIVLTPRLGKGLVGALHDALGADIDPAARSHLAVHGEATAIELREVLPGGPARHQVRVGDQHPGRICMGPEYPGRPAGLHQQGLLVSKLPEALDHAVEVVPAACGAADAAVDDQILWILRDLGVEVVHQHAKRRLGLPGTGRSIRSSGRDDRAGIGEVEVQLGSSQRG